MPLEKDATGRPLLSLKADGGVPPLHWLIDGQPLLSCLTLAVDCEGRAIDTIEGMADGPTLHPLQEAFADLGAAQCGYCTPGFLLTAKAMLESDPNPDLPTMQNELSGNLCRCTGYLKIYEAIDLAAARMRGEPAEPTQEMLHGH